MSLCQVMTPRSRVETALSLEISTMTAIANPDELWRSHNTLVDLTQRKASIPGQQER